MLVALSFSLVGCQDRLNIDQKGVISMENYYKTDADAEAALAAAYYTAGRFYSNFMWTSAGWNDCPLLSMWEYASDEFCVSGSDKMDGVEGNQIQSFRMDNNAVVVVGSYETYYMVVKGANDVICNFEGEKADTPIKKRAVAEARIIRAHAHLLLALGWGAVPIVDRLLTGDDRPENSESQAAVLEWIAKECDEAMADLTSKSSVNDKNGAIKITKEFAYALKGKALISKHDYAGAKAALKKVIDSNLYALVPSNEMQNLHHNSGRASTEAVFELNFDWFSGMNSYGRTQPNFKWLWSWRSDRFGSVPGEVMNGGWGWNNPSKKYVDHLLKHDGMESARRKAYIKSYEEVLYELPYGNDVDSMTKAEKETNKSIGIISPQGIYGNVGWFSWKKLFRTEDAVAEDGNVADWNLMVMGYAEVLLLYAEACAMTSDDGTGLNALKAVNERAQAQTKVTTLTMDAVKAEKFAEMYLDGTRFQDIIRWGDGVKELGDNGKYYPTFKDKINEGGAKHEGYIDESDAGWCDELYDVGFKAGKNELFPYPFNAMQLNPNLKQNPGWE